VPIGNSPLAVLLNPDRDMTKFAKVVPSVDPRIVSVEAMNWTTEAILTAVAVVLVVAAVVGYRRRGMPVT